MDDLLKKYLKQKGVKEINELTEDDAFSFFYDRHGGFVRRCQGNLALMAIKEGRLTKSEVVKSMVKALETGQRFGCHFILGESGDGNRFPPVPDHWELTPKVD